MEPSLTDLPREGAYSSFDLSRNSGGTSVLIPGDGIVAALSYLFSEDAPYAPELQLIAASIRFASNPSGWRTYTDSNYGFTVQYPPGSKLESDGIFSAIITPGTEGCSFRYNGEGLGRGLEQYGSLPNETVLVGSESIEARRYGYAETRLPAVEIVPISSSSWIELNYPSGPEAGQGCREFLTTMLSTFSTARDRALDSGWTEYQNSVVGYRLLYPPGTVIDEGPGLVGVGAPGTMGYCVTLRTDQWLVVLHAKDDPNEAICGRTGVAAGELIQTKEKIGIAGRLYSLELNVIDPSNALGNQDEWFWVKDVAVGSGLHRVDGEGIGGGVQSFNASKGVMLEVLQSITQAKQ